MKKLVLLCAIGLLSAGFNKSNGQAESGNTDAYRPLPASTEFDVVILNGQVIDPETKFEGIRNVGIKDGTIALITEESISGNQTIDASGKVVSPGFIDLHAHGQNIGDYRMQAMQGVTTMLELESGVLPISGWYNQQAQLNLPLNYGASAGWTFARIATFTGTDPEPTSKYFQDAQSRSSGIRMPASQ